MFKLRGYQDKGVEACKEVLLSKVTTKQVVVAPTGAGKSIYIAYAAKYVDYPLIVLQPSKELLKQNYSKFTQIGEKASIYSVSCKEFQRNRIPYTTIDGKEKPCQEIGHITYATIGSIMKDWEKFKKLGVKGIIIDECHIGTQKNSQIKKFIKKVNIKNVLGLTATPIYLSNTMEGAVLKIITRVRSKLFSDIKHVTQIEELVRNKYWSPLVYRVFEEDGAVLKPNSNGLDFTEQSQKEFYELNNIDKKVKVIVEKLRKQGIRKSILIFVPTIASAEELSVKIKDSRVVHSKMSMKERDEVIEDFRNLKIDVVINVNIMAIGFDHPQLDTIITTRPTMSIGIYYQSLGRGVRIHPTKASCAILDFSGNFQRFGKVEELNFEHIEGYGWGMFKGDILLSDYPMMGINRPTKKSLALFRGKSGFIKFDFGKYKGKTIDEVGREDKGYLVWMYDKFTFRGEKGRVLKEDIKNYLKL